MIGGAARGFVGCDRARGRVRMRMREAMLQADPMRRWSEQVRGSLDFGSCWSTSLWKQRSAQRYVTAAATHPTESVSLLSARGCILVCFCGVLCLWLVLLVVCWFWFFFWFC